MNQETSTAPLRRTRPARAALAALSGVLAAFAALCAGELLSAAVRPESSPVTAVGGAVVDRTPVEVKDWAIRAFGDDDKLVLLGGILVLLALFAAAVGLVARRHRPAGVAGVLLFGLLGTVAALSRPGAGWLDALPSAGGAVAGAGVLWLLAGRLTPSGAGTTEPPGGRAALDRRGFVLAAGASAAVSAGAGFAGRRLGGSGAADAEASRAGVRLPRPASPARPVPARARPRVAGLSPFTTPNRDFYRVDTALVVPRVDVGSWRLKVHGEGVRRPLELDLPTLLRRDLIERDITLTCVSNEVGGPYVSSARWLGVPLGPLLEEAGVRPPSRGGPAGQLVSRSVDGMTIGTPVDTVMDGRDAMLAVGMNGEPLPFRHGFPLRMVVPGLYGYVSACKWLQELELTTFDAFDPYWVERNWAREAPVKTQARIDTPRAFARLRAGTVRVAGVAWAQHRGIRRVETRVDGGPWQEARLAAQASPDTWRQWVWDWPATRGSHTLEVRATDATGARQTSRRQGTVPDGATGLHSVVVSVD
ncbi:MULTISPECIES: molybdopterin-dependent oxidoreductase [Streptomyces diastaticus group]|uniref:Oxidoreductase n=2 Tax=Streptomyces diastaticus group TaxID=2849069 RepID=A0A8H9HWQ3_9ACTN|nr:MULTISPECIES: molybdopterin-dependent oxidoreductase [Streptomyces diastaticus group]WSU38621.1 molybdopterin-dependent oxidoreductase [Streptomyces gougerotii]GFH71932.1 oxidoreductase [Streptomyces diastaticus subsp. diastaticus]GFH76302.1 oxidoreductase [Streptomyces gougerotii]GGU40713.1 oxidoreductase [Streptomyces diastaticus subsp. diastaticus]GGU93061.1 oxidoreductase [Streptomyces gougerotii]